MEDFATRHDPDGQRTRSGDFRLQMLVGAHKLVRCSGLDWPSDGDAFRAMTAAGSDAAVRALTTLRQEAPGAWLAMTASARHRMAIRIGLAAMATYLQVGRAGH